MEATLKTVTSTLRISSTIARSYASKNITSNHSLRHSRQYTLLATQHRRFINPRQGNQQKSTAQHFPVLLNSHRSLSSAAISITTKDESEKLAIQWPDGDTIEYSYAWLRDGCLCPKCHEPTAKARLLRMKDLPEDCKPREVKVESCTIQITWNDGHVSPFPVDWLKEKGFSPKNIEERKKVWPLPAESWGGEFVNNIPKDSFNNLMTNDRALYDWICNMEKFGFFLITDTPCEVGRLEEFSKRIAFLRLTNYGKSFTVKAKIDPSNAAYTSAALGLHVDLPYYYYTPGVQMLHCIKQVSTKGGENQFADGFYVAEIVKKLRPDYYKTLCTSLVDFYDIGTDYYKFHKFARRPVIQFDTMGNMTQINYNNQVRDYFAHLPADELTALFKAMKFYDDVMYKPENHIHIKLKDGEVACFHNYRVLHGREGYEVTGGGERHYEGGYLDWDELHSKRRVLQEELNL